MILLLLLLLFGASAPSEMTIEEKVGQLLVVHFHGGKANEESCRLIQEAHVGGFIYYNWANGLTSPEQVAALSGGLQQQSPYPLWIAVDQEGGPVARLREGFPSFPGQRAIAVAGDLDFAEDHAYRMGLMLREAGINMNFSPVVDVSSDPKATVMTGRTFGDTPGIVVAFARRFLEGYRRAGIVGVLKHYPGCGDVRVDPHLDLPVNEKSLDALYDSDLIPFYALSRQADVIMSAHLLVPELDVEHCATLSPFLLNDLLRNKIGFDGLIISDSLAMEGLLKNCGSLEEAAVLAIEAGCDLLCLGGRQLEGENAGFELSADDVISIHRALVEAVKSGRIPMDQLDDSVARSLALKRQYTKI